MRLPVKKGTIQARWVLGFFRIGRELPVPTAINSILKTSLLPFG